MPFDSLNDPAYRRRVDYERGGPKSFVERVRPAKGQPTLLGFGDNDHEPTKELPKLQIVEPVKETPPPAVTPATSSGEKAKARDILAAIRTLKAVERGAAPAHRRRDAGPPPLRRVRSRGALHLPRPDHRQSQRRLAAAGGRAERPAHARGVRLGQADHLHGILHRPRCHGRHARGSRQAGRARQRDHSGAGLWEWKLHRPWQARPALHRRGAGQPLRSHSPPASSAGRYPHRELPRYPPPASGRRHRQRPVRGYQTRTPRAASEPARLLHRQVSQLTQARRRVGGGDQPLHHGQAERSCPGNDLIPGRLPRRHPPAVRCLQARGDGRRHRHRVPAEAGARSGACGRGLVEDRNAGDRRRQRGGQPVFPRPPGGRAGHLEPQGHALRRRGVQRALERGSGESAQGGGGEVARRRAVSSGAGEPATIRARPASNRPRSATKARCSPSSSHLHPAPAASPPHRRLPLHRRRQSHPPGRGRHRPARHLLRGFAPRRRHAPSP